jgi:hypothetical protein
MKDDVMGGSEPGGEEAVSAGKILVGVHPHPRDFENVRAVFAEVPIKAVS